MAEWRTTTLGDLCVLRGGSAFPRHEQGLVAGEIPFIKVSDLNLAGNGYQITEANNFVSDATASRMALATAESGSTVFAKIGAAIMAERYRVLTRRTAFDNNMMAATAIKGVSDPRFLYYLLATLELSRSAVGSALPYLTQGALAALPCRVPDLVSQRAIAEVLGALDDKIAANTRLVTAADELATALFSRMLDEAEMRPLTSTARFVNGRNFTTGASGSGRVVIRIAELNSGLGGSTVFSDAEVADDHVARPGDVLFAWSGSLTLHRWYRPEGVVNQHIFKVIPNPRHPRWLVWHLIERRLDEFKAIAADKATTMGHIQRRHLDEPVPVPVASVVAANDARMSALWDRALADECENLALAATRDALLPALMSGALRVRDAERVVEGAV